ncbi:Holin of 3TMs, for gene-transfer release [Paracoccus isoporae]|uniref:Holin of 3TMs, for gene-transfer release n=1 Tax=Paracoccus isoporae TaxID=591205 RepID=A0A1G7BCY3_9RHOB|nr:holin family protein [Paracoccus isoporae]SDE24807.1 Holin of 3TMs, for gene-transfer release [Paracoccus isoporae]
MGMIDRLIGIGPAAQGVAGAAADMAGVFHENATRRMELEADAHRDALSQFGAEFAAPRPGRFDGFVNGLNRLPRPCMAIGTLALFVFAMAAPARFAERMAGLHAVPEPLWWLLGAIVSFYFGAREAHYFRNPGSRGRGGRRPGSRGAEISAPQQLPDAGAAQLRPTPAAISANYADNAALQEWQAEMRAAAG